MKSDESALSSHRACCLGLIRDLVSREATTDLAVAVSRAFQSPDYLCECSVHITSLVPIRHETWRWELFGPEESARIDFALTLPFSA